MYLLAQSLFRAAQQRSHVSNLDSERGGDLGVTQSAVSEHQDRSRPLRQPLQCAADLASFLGVLDRALGAYDRRPRRVERVSGLTLRAPAVATNHVQRRMDG